MSYMAVSVVDFLRPLVGRPLPLFEPFSGTTPGMGTSIIMDGSIRLTWLGLGLELGLGLGLGWRLGWRLGLGLG